jgi:hypothetical protein
MLPGDVAAIRRRLSEVLSERDDQGRVYADATFGVYAFYDYDNEPIYVGQTRERLRVRIRRHLTNQRTDAVAMNVLDPFEVAEIEMWPFFDFEGRRNTDAEAVAMLNRAEFTVFQRVLEASTFNAVLNEKDIAVAETVELPPSLRASIIPPDLYEARKHPDVRIARRANTIASLARVISERDVSPGLRRTLLTQARRIENLAGRRLAETGYDFPVEAGGEETGETIA